MKFIIRVLGICLAFIHYYSTAQPQFPDTIITYAQSIVDTLCSDSLAGRGYISEGHVKAATFIASEFEHIGLKPMISADSYFQHFPIDINLAKQAKISVGDDTLDIGSDFIINRFSGSGKGSSLLIDLGFGLTSSLETDITGKMILLREGWPDSLVMDAEARAKYDNRKLPIERIIQYLPRRPSGAIVIRPKLTAGYVKQALPFPVIDILADSIILNDSASWDVSTELQTIESQNVIGFLPGDMQSDSLLLICAHYDHMGMQAESIFRGANDNASGIAMLLSLARYFSNISVSERMPTVFIAFGGEETGLDGSKFFVETPSGIQLDKIKFVLNLDLMGNGDEGIVAVAGYEFPTYFQLLEKVNKKLSAIPRVERRKNRPNSDHFYFVQQQIPAFFIFTLGGAPHYHDIYDTPQNVPLDDFISIRTLLIEFISQIYQY